jgi:hypothetical protein
LKEKELMERKNNLPKAITGLLLSIVVLFMVSCSFSTANISSADLAKEVPGGKPEKISGTTFHTADGPFHLLVIVANAPEGTKVKASWFAVEAGNEKGTLIDENEITLTNETDVDFNLSLPRPWPVGKYKVDLYLNSKLDRTIPFDVKE